MPLFSPGWGSERQALTHCQEDRCRQSRCCSDRPRLYQFRHPDTHQPSDFSFLMIPALFVDLLCTKIHKNRYAKNRVTTLWQETASCLLTPCLPGTVIAGYYRESRTSRIPDPTGDDGGRVGNDANPSFREGGNPCLPSSPLPQPASLGPGKRLGHCGHVGA